MEDTDTKKLLFKPTELYQEANKRYDELFVAKTALEKSVRKYPEGKIHIVRKKNKVQYYLRTSSQDKSGEYISKKQMDMIKVYLQKRYEEDVLRLLNIEMTSLEKFLKKSNEINLKIQSLYSENPLEIQKCINPIDMKDEDYAIEWQNKPYQKKNILDNIPVFVTNRGEKVRSKSELMIANRLHQLKIPYKYECALTLSGGRVIYPDFTIWDVKNRREVYWEHRGMMDNQDYANHSVQRMKEYNRQNIFPGKNLIITEETSTMPLETREIDNIIVHYFQNI